MFNRIINLAESGWIPDWMIRIGIRQLLAQRLGSLKDEDSSSQNGLIQQMEMDHLAVETQAANEQHYEVSAKFFQRVLGSRLKYSCGLYETDSSTLDQAESAMLALTCQRAEIEDGQSILELGCGWGSLTIWMAEHFPNSRITAVSNSHSQRAFIEEQLRIKGLSNATILTRDMRSFESAERFDRIVSVEMFEHMRNYRQLFQRISKWLNEGGRLFAHIFCHRSSTYLFETEGASNWMGRHFFTGGTMPSRDLFLHFNQDLKIDKQWEVCGMHYWRTAEHWLQNLDRHSAELQELFTGDLGKRKGAVALQRWRMFMLACAELFRYNGGSEWFVAHYLFSPVTSPSENLRLNDSLSTAAEVVC
jgi:cyclopropane-fatty-acyl-phospholipid synthase